MAEANQGLRALPLVEPAGPLKASAGLQIRMSLCPDASALSDIGESSPRSVARDHDRRITVTDHPGVSHLIGGRVTDVGCSSIHGPHPLSGGLLKA